MISEIQFGALRQIAGANDFQVAGYFETFVGLLLQRVRGDLGENSILKLIPENELGDKARSWVEDESFDETRPVDGVATTELARALLVEAATEAVLAPLVIEAVESWPDDRQKVRHILAFGLVVSTWMCLASIKFKAELPGFTIEKTETSAEQIEALASLLDTIIGAWHVGGKSEERSD